MKLERQRQDNNKDQKISRRRFLKASSLASQAAFYWAERYCIALENGVLQDAIYFNGKIVTLDSAESTVSGVAVKDGKILKVGNGDELKKLAGPSTRLVDLTVRRRSWTHRPHCHPMETIYLKEAWVDCRYPGTPSVKKALANIAEWAKKTPKGEWIYVACVFGE